MYSMYWCHEANIICDFIVIAAPSLSFSHTHTHPMLPSPPSLPLLGMGEITREGEGGAIVGTNVSGKEQGVSLFPW